MNVDPAVKNNVDSLASQIADEARLRFGKSTQVFWFGSWVNGGASEVSDLDLAFDLSDSVSVTDFNDFIDWVEQLPTLYKFDLINMTEISERFKKHILSSGQLI